MTPAYRPGQKCLVGQREQTQDPVAPRPGTGHPNSPHLPWLCHFPVPPVLCAGSEGSLETDPRKGCLDFPHQRVRVSLMTQVVKNLPAIQETQVQSLVQEDPLEEGMATHLSILVWRIP